MYQSKQSGEEVTELCFLSACEAIAAFRSRKLSPIELTKALVARSESLQPALNAFTTTFYKRAIELAALAEEAYVSGRERPLEGSQS